MATRAHETRRVFMISSIWVVELAAEKPSPDVRTASSMLSPPLTPRDLLEVSMIHSVAGELAQRNRLGLARSNAARSAGSVDDRLGGRRTRTRNRLGLARTNMNTHVFRQVN